MLKMFFSSPYNVRHSTINESNACEMLKDDIRSKMIGDVKGFVYASDEVPLKINPNISYIGGFYYEKNNYPNALYGECENVVKTELNQINNSDIVVISLLKYSAIASITELIYAASLGKKIIIFCDPKITQFKIEYEYWFPIITSISLTNVKVIFVQSEDEIIDYIRNLVI